MSRSRRGVGAPRRLACRGVDMAHRRCRLAWVLGGRQHVRGRTTPGHRHRTRRRSGGPRAGRRRGDLRRVASDVRRHGHHHDLGRLQGVVDAPGRVARPSRCERLGRTADRRRRAVGRAGAAGAFRPSRHPVRRGRDLRRSAHAPSVPSSARSSSHACARADGRAFGRAQCSPRSRAADVLERRGHAGSLSLDRGSGVAAAVRGADERGRDIDLGVHDVREADLDRPDVSLQATGAAHRRGRSHR